MSKLFHEKLYTFWRDYASIDENDQTMIKNYGRPIYYLLEAEEGDFKAYNCQLHLESIFKDIFNVFYGEVVDLRDNPPQTDPLHPRYLTVQKDQILDFESRLKELQKECNDTFETVSYYDEFLINLRNKFQTNLIGIIGSLSLMHADPTFTHEIPLEAVINNLIMRLQNFAND